MEKSMLQILMYGMEVRLYGGVRKGNWVRSGEVGED